MQKLRSPLAMGQRVEVRGDVWLVGRREQFEECAVVTLRGAGEENLGSTLRVVTPFEKLKPVRVPVRMRQAKRQTVFRTAAHAVARAHGWSAPWTAAGAQIDLLAWQLEPAMAAVAGRTRILLADEVGLGKTIQSGLILTELRARGLIGRTLILAPASLREQWAAELQDRFRVEPQVLDHASLAALVTSLPVGVNPWATAEIAVSSIDLVKRPEVRLAIDAVPIDLLIVDEAHHLKSNTERGALVADLATRVPWVVLVTATPHSGDERQFSFLRRIGAGGNGDDLLVFRRTAVQIGRQQSRRERFHAVEATVTEQTLLTETVAYASAVWHHQSHGLPHGPMVASVICRRAVSCAYALVRTLERRTQLLRSRGGSESPLPELPWLETDGADDLPSDEILGAPGLADTNLELAWIERLIGLAKQIGHRGAKFNRVQRLLCRTSEAAIVFSEYRDTLVALESCLARRCTLATLNGAMSPRERREAVERFVSGNARVLLATDAAGEGLNLQARCRLVLNLELPWNPVRLEQRIGRVDRLGQTRRVHAHHLYYRDSYEGTVLVRLCRRIDRAASEMPGSASTDDVIASDIFGDHTAIEKPLHQAHPTHQTDSTHQTYPTNVETLQLARRAAALAFAPGGRFRHHAGPVCTASTPGSRCARSVALLFAADIYDASGRLIAREVVPIHTRVSAMPVLNRETVRHLTSKLATAQQVQRVLSETLRARVALATTEVAQTRNAFRARLDAILNTLESPRPVMFQGSLFDRRAEREARASSAAASELCAHLRWRRAALAGLHDLHAEPRLVAAWVARSE